MIKGYLVQHTHWDREWYFTTEDSIVLSDQVFTEAIEELQNNKRVNFVLDGQTSIIDEYLEINPEKYEVVKELVGQNRLFIGPWFTQTDCLLVDAESILRNLIIGISDTRNKYGKVMMHGYLPDTFGFNAQLPTILNHAGIDTFFAWRGIHFKKISPSPYFKWKGLGKSFVYAMYFPNGYMTALMTLDAINDIDKFVLQKLDPGMEFLSENGQNNDVLLPVGIDQKSMILEFDRIVEDINKVSKYNVSISSYDEFSEIIKSKKDNLPVYRGDLRLPVYSRVHRTISSVRTKMKIENFKLEQSLIRKIEPLMVIAEALGIKVSKGLLRRVWKKVLENQAHDSLGGCVSNNVAVDINHRIKQTNEIIDSISNLILKRISDNLELKSNEILLVNTDPYVFSGEKIINIVTRSKNLTFSDAKKFRIIEEKLYPERHNVQKLVSTGFEYITEPKYYELKIGLDIQLPPMGYKIVEFEESEKSINKPQCSLGNCISNGKYKLVFEDNQINLYYKNNLHIEDFISLRDCGNDGDTYDFSPVENEKEFKIPFLNSHIIKGLEDILVVEGNCNLPYSLEDRVKETKNVKKVDYKINLSFKKDGAIIGEIFYNNTVLSHRLRLKLKTEAINNSAIAQIQNGFIDNENLNVEDNWKEEYVEKPTNINVFDKSVTVKAKGFYMTTYVDGIKEYEVFDNNLFITLFATTGQLGKPDLLWRPGRASGDTTNEGHVMMPTPLAQETGKHHIAFEIALKNEFDEYETYKHSLERLSQSISYQRQILNKFINRIDNKVWPFQKEKNKLKRQFSLFKLPEKLIVSAIYPSYFEENKMVIRLSNPSSKLLDLKDMHLENFEVVNAIEEVQDISELKIHPYDYLTLRCDIKQIR